MHTIEPFFNWQHLYNSETDEQCEYFGTVHSEFQFSNTVYNYFVHPQWDTFGSETLYLKILFVDYEDGYCIIEMIGEWNDAIENDSMILKRNLIDIMIQQGIKNYIFITENVLNYHSGDVDYYQEWHEEIAEEGGGIYWLNLPESSQYDFVRSKVKNYVMQKEILNWRTMSPMQVYEQVVTTMLD
jgi:hypothetical protein